MKSKLTVTATIGGWPERARTGMEDVPEGERGAVGRQSAQAELSPEYSGMVCSPSRRVLPPISPSKSSFVVSHFPRSPHSHT